MNAQFFQFILNCIKKSSKGTAPKVSKGRSESPLGSEAFVASGDKEKAERVSRNERPLAATIEAADAARRRETSALGIAIVLSKNSIMQKRSCPDAGTAPF